MAQLQQNDMMQSAAFTEHAWLPANQDNATTVDICVQVKQASNCALVLPLDGGIDGCLGAFKSELWLWMLSMRLAMDRYICGIGMDRYICGIGMDRYICGIGMDRYICGTGMDRYICGTGMDRYICGIGMDRYICGIGMDRFLKSDWFAAFRPIGR